MSRTQQLRMFMLVLLLSCSVALNVSRREYTEHFQILAVELPADTGSGAGNTPQPDITPRPSDSVPSITNTPPAVSTTPTPNPPATTPIPETSKPTEPPKTTPPTPTPSNTSTTPPPNTKPAPNDPETTTKPTNSNTANPTTTSPTTKPTQITRITSKIVTITGSNGLVETTASTGTVIETSTESSSHTNESQSNQGGSKTVMTVGIVVGCVVVISAVGIWVFRKWKLKPSRNFKDKINSDTDNFFAPPAHSISSNRDRDAVFLRELNES